jgi:hypothetical protein
MLRRSARPLAAAARAAAAAGEPAAAGASAAGGVLLQWQRAAAAAGGGGGGRRWMSEPTGSAKEAVERTLVVNTLDMVRGRGRGGWEVEQAWGVGSSWLFSSRAATRARPLNPGAPLPARRSQSLTHKAAAPHPRRPASLRRRG